MKLKIYRSYIIGLVISLITTTAAFVLVSNRLEHAHSNTNKNSLIVAILVLAVIQFGVQIIFFLHLGQEKKPYLNNIALVFTIAMIMMLVIGTIWIMNNLNYNTHDQYRNQEKEIIEDEGFHHH